MDVFAKWLSLIIVVIAALIFGMGYWVLDYEFSEIFIAVVGLTVAAIPEGLPAVLTITLAVGVQAMARRNAIVRQLPAIETLGSVSVICTDKTGTLTRNEMSVTHLLTADDKFEISGEGYAPIGEVRPLLKDGVGSESSLLDIGLVALLCNDSQLQKNDKNEWVVEGDPMEGALMAFAGKLGLDLHDDKRKWTQTDVIPFDARYRYMATLNHDHKGNAVICVKGAPEKILDICS